VSGAAHLSGPGAILTTPIGGGTADTFAADQLGPGGMAIDGAHVHWVNAGSGTIMRQGWR